MSMMQLLSVVPLLAMLFWAAAEDLHSRRIRNWLSFSILLTGFVQSCMPHGTVSPGQSAMGFAVGFALPFALFALGAVGGGDVKLLAGVGAWLGGWAIFKVFCAEAILGMLIVLAQAAVTGRLRVLSRNSAIVAMNLVHVSELGLEHTKLTGQSSRSVDKPLPYAVPVLISAVLVIFGLI